MVSPSSLNSTFPSEGLGADGRLRKRGKAAERIFHRMVSTYAHFDCPYCYTYRLLCAGRGMTVPRNGSYIADYPNPAGVAGLHKQPCCAARVCRACADPNWM